MSVTIHQAGEYIAPRAAAMPSASNAPTAAPTPSETIIRAAPGRKVAEITLSTGRVFAVRKLGPLDRMLASKAIGAEHVVNPLYASYAMVACSITAIDRMPVAMPSSQMQIEALVNRVADDWDELAEEMGKAFKPAESEAFDPDAIKN